MPLATLIKPIPRRAVLAFPHTATEVHGLVAAMKKLGLNQLWIPVAAASTAPDTHTLLQAVQATKGTDISVYAVVDLLTMTQGTPADAVDLTLLGRTSAQAQATLAEREALAGPLPYVSVGSSPLTGSVAVSPFSAAIGRNLLPFMHTLMTMPGIAGLVWRATATPGYDKGGETDADAASLALGYTLPGRLAFLRKEHVDPVDLSPVGVRGLADTSLPGFNDAAMENTLETKWDQFRSDADLSLLRKLFQQVTMDRASTASQPFVLVQQRGPRPPTVTWYGSWVGPDAPLPTYRFSAGTLVAEKVQARAQSKLTIVNLPIHASLGEAAIMHQWSGPLQSIGKNHSWDGFVIECQPTKVP